MVNLETTEMRKRLRDLLQHEIDYDEISDDYRFGDTTIHWMRELGLWIALMSDGTYLSSETLEELSLVIPEDDVMDALVDLEYGGSNE